MSRGVVAAAVAAVFFAVMALAEEAPYAHHAPTACIRLACSHTLLRTVRPQVRAVRPWAHPMLCPRA